MKKKVLKIIALVIAVALIVGVCIVTNALNGNPISKLLAEKAANEYLQEKYNGTDYYVERVGFNFKDTNYYAHICSDSSIDTQFTLSVDMLGHVTWDTYEDVLSGAVTARRVEQDYRALTDQVLESTTFPYGSDIAYGTLEIYPQVAMDDPLVTDIPEYALTQEDLILDYQYDPRDLGAQAGHLIIYVDSDTITTAYAAEVLLTIREAFDQANIPLKAIDFVLHYPLPEEGPRPKGQIKIENFPYEDIYAEGLEDRIAKAHDDLQAYYAQQDAAGK